MGVSSKAHGSPEGERQHSHPDGFSKGFLVEEAAETDFEGKGVAWGMRCQAAGAVGFSLGLRLIQCPPTMGLTWLYRSLEFPVGLRGQDRCLSRCKRATGSACR